MLHKVNYLIKKKIKEMINIKKKSNINSSKDYLFVLEIIKELFKEITITIEFMKYQETLK